MERNWWKEMVVYQIWPRSFCDGNGDGIGDLKGVLGKLEYIRDLGATPIWFSPLYVSPQADYGYDIADYRNINPEYGTLDDFKEVLEKAHSLGLRVIMDLVVNHTSNRHEWFLKSREGGENNPYKDYYIWRKGKGKDGKKFPNNWTSTFPGDGWQYDEKRKEYYLHLFAVEQPDLNMDNPAVRQEVKDIMKYWLDMGVDGFREDVITFISKREGLPNGFPLMPAARGMEHYKNGPRIHEFLREFKTVWNSYDAMTVGEAPMMTPKTALKYISYDKQELNMMFHFQHMEADCFLYSWVHTGFNLVKLKKVYNNWQTKLYGKAWNALYIENHDQPRIISRYGSEKFRVESGKALAVMYLCQSGTPFIYQGQEIGMTNFAKLRREDYRDIVSIRIYDTVKKIAPFLLPIVTWALNKKARDHARAPMQWNAKENAGFTTGTPWMPLNPNYKEINVEQALADKDGIWYFYKNLNAFRIGNEVIRYGSYKQYYPKDKHVWTYEREYNGKKYVVIANYSDREVQFVVPEELKGKESKYVMGNYGDSPKTLTNTVLRPYEAMAYEL